MPVERLRSLSRAGCTGNPPPSSSEPTKGFPTPPHTRRVGREEPRYHIPSDELVLQALERVTSTKRTVHSQRQLKRLVEKELRGEEHYRIGERRLRLLAIDSGQVHLQTLFREMDEKVSMRRCPVCGSKPKRLRNMTVFGGTVTLGYKCDKCGFWTGLRKRLPTRYVFTRK